MRERELVQRLARADQCLEAMRALVGGVIATELRRVRVTDAAFTALIDGIQDPNARVRWWCIQLLEHISDQRAIDAIVPALNDPVPRVPRNAAHAVGCALCKQGWDGIVPADVVETLARMAVSDENAKVRAQARLTLACRGVG